ncbi:MAG: type I DNA topoisomerase [Parabacteroides merdae]
MQKNLVIVESPAKAKTIEKFLGKDYKVMSSYGHIRDLKTKEFSIDIEHDYAPQYVIPADKKKLVSELKSEAKSAEQVWLASDEDREGEAISWHLYEVLGLKPENTKRIVFHEITKNAILHAIETPRDININLVNAQQARRVLDRIVGFELSPILWRKGKTRIIGRTCAVGGCAPDCGTGREINEFVSEAAFRVIANFILPDGTTVLKAELNRRLKDKKEVEAFLESCKNASFTIDDITTKPVKKSPAPPFTTSTLQQEAARKLGYSVSQTMMIAQRLYESGLITYMRTDSVNLSDLALGTAKEAIFETYGEKYYKFRQYHTKSKGAQEAHEAIRPTYISNVEAGSSSQEKKLYELIRKRTIACQMADAELERTTISVGISGQTERFVAVGEVISFEGFLQVYMESNDDDTEKEQENGLLPPVKLHETLSLKDIVATERFTQRPPRYTEASLVRRLEELGIGRPSTYAPTIQTIQNREYVVKGDKEGVERAYTVVSLSKGKIEEAEKTETVGADRNKLMPTDIGTVVNDFLMEYFPDVLDYNFTASVEKEFDSVAEGELVWTKAIDKFYKIFHPIVEATAAVKTEHKVGERELGIDPKSGNPVFVKIGRYGPVVQIGAAHADDKEAPKPQFASLMKGQSIDTITLEEALKLFDLPRTGR